MQHALPQQLDGGAQPGRHGPGPDAGQRLDHRLDLDVAQEAQRDVPLVPAGPAPATVDGTVQALDQVQDAVGRPDGDEAPGPHGEAAMGGGAGAPGTPAGAGGGAAAHAFDGLALPPVREADVFSGLPLGADDPMLGGGKSGNVRKPGRRPPGGGRRGGAAEAATPEELAPLPPLPPLPPVSKRRRGGAAAYAQDEAAPASPPPSPHPAPGRGDASRPRAAPPAPGHAWNDPLAMPVPPRRRGGIGPYIVAMILALGWKGPNAPELAEKGIRCRVSSFARHYVNSSLSKAK